MLRIRKGNVSVYRFHSASFDALYTVEYYKCQRYSDIYAKYFVNYAFQDEGGLLYYTCILVTVTVTVTVTITVIVTANLTVIVTVAVPIIDVSDICASNDSKVTESG